MSCSSCSIGIAKTPSGCQNNGVCGSGGCNKKNTYDWLYDLNKPDFGFDYPYIEVSFKGGRKSFFSNPDNLDLTNGDPVIVEVSGGHDLGFVTLKGELVKLQMKKYHVEDNESIKRIYRHANKYDLEKWESAKALESSSLSLARKMAMESALEMKISDIEYQADKRKVTVYYSSEEI